MAVSCTLCTAHDPCPAWQQVHGFRFVAAHVANLHDAHLSAMVGHMGIGTGGRRERKKIATHIALRSAALRLVAERGLHQVTVEDIAEEADVSVRTFFNYFPSKEDAIVGMDPEKAELLRESLAARPAEEPPLAALEAVLSELGTGIAERSEDWSLRLAIVKGSPALLPRFLASFATYERALVEGVAARVGVDPDSDLYPTVVVEASIGALRAAVGQWRSEEAKRSLPDLIGEAFGHLAAGLPQPGWPGHGAGAGCGAAASSTTTERQPLAKAGAS